MPEKTPDEIFEELVEKGDIKQCAGCGAYNAMAHQDSNVDEDGVRIIPDDGLADGGEIYGEDEFPMLYVEENIYHSGTGSGFEWQCGKYRCRASNVPHDSPLLHPCYTHSED